MKKLDSLYNSKEEADNGLKPIRYSIRFKIFVVSLLPTFALLAAALLNHQYLSSLGESAEQILSQNYKSIRAAQQARKLLEETRNQLLEVAVFCACVGEQRKCVLCGNAGGPGSD